ncbi:hypothetical protein C8R45DRAFT_933039 [Mycena sanguinolenta]|nr:hypothetical protein C8R45DRAFT_933039 [Mycena sanguinolenta]
MAVCMHNTMINPEKSAVVHWQIKWQAVRQCMILKCLRYAATADIATVINHTMACHSSETGYSLLWLVGSRCERTLQDCTMSMSTLSPGATEPCRSTHATSSVLTVTVMKSLARPVMGRDNVTKDVEHSTTGAEDVTNHMEEDLSTHTIYFIEFYIILQNEWLSEVQSSFAKAVAFQCIAQVVVSKKKSAEVRWWKEKTGGEEEALCLHICSSVLYPLMKLHWGCS